MTDKPIHRGSDLAAVDKKPPIPVGDLQTGSIIRVTQQLIDSGNVSHLCSGAAQEMIEAGSAAVTNVKSTRRATFVTLNLIVVLTLSPDTMITVVKAPSRVRDAEDGETAATPASTRPATHDDEHAPARRAPVAAIIFRAPPQSARRTG